VRAAVLDEALDVVTALWSGEPVTYEGVHHRVRGAQMQPRPLQQPRIPVWIGGRWPSRPPFRRAARYDGVMPTHAGYGKGTTMPPADLAAIVAYVSDHREQDTPFDVVLEGATRPDSAAEQVAAYAASGLTWWVEALGPWRGSVADMRDRVAQGPPRPQP
jgi:alkanesulfonate monooxygenase SsuD/methylene tetrahydromethanopterin reductase-like flavin-dependent oxidoreductase (luciferase family)